MARIKKDVYDLRAKLEQIYGKKEIGEKPLVSIVSPTIDSLYFDTVLAALKHGRINPIDSGSFAGSHRLEFNKAALCVTNPTTRPLAPTARPGIPSSTDEESIEKYFHRYLLDGKLGPDEHYTYASWIVGMGEKILNESEVHNLEIGLIEDTNQIERIEKDIQEGWRLYKKRSEKGIPRGTRLNQLEWCVNHFVEKGYGTNHCAITIGSAEGLQRYDWPWKDETERGTTECLRNISMKIRDNKLNFSVFFRSWDLIAGLPENLGGLTRLMEYTSEWINATKKDDQPEVEVGTLYADSDGLHIYEANLNLAKLWTNLEETKKED